MVLADRSKKMHIAGWRRPLWMGLAALCAGSAIPIIVFASPALQRVGQVQFMHGMATFACATFMNIGAHEARRSPAGFLAGNLLWCTPAYAAAAGCPASVLWLRPLGLAAYCIAWVILAWSARSIDRQ
jgi:uncharacterized membrane protein YgdD (TMEM256/DUF423 family)